MVNVEVVALPRYTDPATEKRFPGDVVLIPTFPLLATMNSELVVDPTANMS